MADQQPTDESSRDAAGEPTEAALPPPSGDVEFSKSHPAPPEAYVVERGAVSAQFLTEDDLAPPPRRWMQPLVLFLATCLTTFWVGCEGWLPTLRLLDGTYVFQTVGDHWLRGLSYMVAVMAILVAHEMGHFLQAVRYRMPASYPFFIPLPVVPMGTLGAVISMDGSRANRREMFDMGISGPLAGLVIAVPMGLYAISTARPVAIGESSVLFNDPLLFQLMIDWLHGPLPAGQALQINSLYMAAWVGMLITGLNMLPISQLDGGHVAYCLFGRRAHLLARALLMFAIAYMIISDNYNWILMVVLVIFIGTDHPPTHDDRAPLGPTRFLLGVASLLLPIFCFMPMPITIP